MPCAVGTLVDIANSTTRLRSRTAELMSAHADVIADKLNDRRVTFHPAQVITDKLNVVGSIHSIDGLFL